MKSGFNRLITFLILLTIPFGVAAVQKAVSFITDAATLPANLVIDLSSDNGSFSDVWRNLAQGGEENGRMLDSVANQVRELQPEYIRIDHVFDYDNLNMMLSDIESIGARPFVSLSYMPAYMARSGNVTDYPVNWADWENLVQKTIEYISGNDGLAINNVYYEVWNEPDLFGNFKTWGEKNYLTLYEHTALAASRASNTKPFKLGGPATTGYYDNWMKKLVNYTQERNLRLDFLSWHRYSKDMDNYLEDINKARILGKELIISELGPSSENDSVYDSAFGAIHQIAVSVMLQNEVSRAFAFEIVDGVGPTQYWGRWGMYTHPKHGEPIEKPRAKAINFLNSLNGGSNLTIYGQGSSVRAIGKKMDDKKYRLLIVNYDEKGLHKEAVPIKLANITSLEFSYKRIDFLGKTATRNINAESSNWETVEFFEPNSAAVIEITFN